MHGTDYAPASELFNAPIHSPAGGFSMHPATPSGNRPPAPGAPPGEGLGYALSPKGGSGMGDLFSFPPTPSSSQWARQAAAAAAASAGGAAANADQRSNSAPYGDTSTEDMK